jgi:hypothetical protein
LLEIFKVALCHQLLALANNLATNNDYSASAKWNNIYQVDIAKVSIMHALYLTALSFREGIAKMDANATTNKALHMLCDLFICDIVLKYGESALLYNYVNSTQMRGVSQHFNDLIDSLKPYLVALIEAQIYHPLMVQGVTLSDMSDDYSSNLYQSALLSPINKKTKLDSHDETVVPLSKKLSSVAKL